MSYNDQKWEHKVASPSETRTLSSAFVANRQIDAGLIIVDQLSLKIIPEKINITSVLPFFCEFQLEGMPDIYVFRNIRRYLNLEDDTLIFDRVDMYQYCIRDFLNKDLSLPEIFAILEGSLNKSRLVGFNTKILELCTLLENNGVHLPLGIAEVIEVLTSENIQIKKNDGDTEYLQPGLREIRFCDRPDLKVHTVNLEPLCNRDYSAYHFNGITRGESSFHTAVLDAEGFRGIMWDLSREITFDNKPRGMDVCIYCIIEGLISICIYENLCLKCFLNWIELMEIKSRETYTTNADFVVFLTIFYDVLIEILDVETTGVQGKNDFAGGKYTALSYIGDYSEELVSSASFQHYEEFIYLFFSGISIGNDQGFNKSIEEFMKNYSLDDGGITGSNESEDQKILNKIIEVAKALHDYFVQKEENYINIASLSNFVASKLAWYYYHAAYTRYVTVGEHRIDNYHGVQKDSFYKLGPIDLMRADVL